MMMFLTVLCLSMLILAITTLAFLAATRPGYMEEPAEQEARPVLKAAPAKFFADEAVPLAAQPRVPIELLLLQLERHVRLEQAAAGSFVEFPTTASLHSRTTSPFVIEREQP